MNKAELIEQLDALSEDLKKAEEDPAVILYNEMRADCNALTEALRAYALTDGAFQTRYVAFQRIKTETVDWKAVCGHLYRTERITDEDILPFKKEKEYAKAMRIKEGSAEMNVES